MLMCLCRRACILVCAFVCMGGGDGVDCMVLMCCALMCV